jgi:ADP-heptose:LPS heptosyltransferase
MENILAIRLKSIGDVIFTLPAIGRLRERFPDARITFLTSKENAPLLQGFSDVNTVIALDRAALRSGHPGKIAREAFGLWRQLRAGQFTLAVDFQGFGETAWLARLSGAPQRWGAVYSTGCRPYSRGVRREDQLHPADWNLKLLAACGVSGGTARNAFTLPADARAAALAIFKQNGLDPEQPTLVIQPFTSTAQKNWPLENYLMVARHWREQGVQVIFAGGPADRLALSPAEAEQFSVAAGVPLLVSAGLVQLASLTLGGDTGLGHLAVALGRRVIMLMMHNQPGACVPFQHPDWVIVPPRAGYIREIPVAAVLAETSRVLKAPGCNASC